MAHSVAFTRENWFQEFAETLGFGRADDRTEAWLQDFILQVHHSLSQNANEKDLVKEKTIRKWTHDGPNPMPQGNTPAFLLCVLERAETLGYVEDKKLFSSVSSYLQSKDKRYAGKRASQLAVPRSPDRQYQILLSRDDPADSKTPTGLGGFYLCIRPRYSKLSENQTGENLYQELLYIGEDAAATSYMITRQRQAIAGKVAFADKLTAHGLFGKPTNKDHGEFSLRHLVIRFHKLKHRFATGITSRVCNSEETLMAASTLLWRCNDQDEPALLEAKRLMELGETIASDALTDWLVTEYSPESPTLQFLEEKLGGLLVAPPLSNYEKLVENEDAVEFDNKIFAHRETARTQAENKNT